MKYQRYELETLRLDLGQTLRIYDLTSANIRIFDTWYFDFIAVTCDLNWWLEMSHPIKQSHTVLLRWGQCHLLRNCKMWVEKTQPYQYTSLKTSIWWQYKKKRKRFATKKWIQCCITATLKTQMTNSFTKPIKSPINQSYWQYLEAYRYLQCSRLLHINHQSQGACLNLWSLNMIK